MADETKISSEGSDGKKVDVTHKRKRVKRIKTAIIITIIFLFLLPTILCIVLGIQLSNLQRQVDNLLSTYSSNTDEKELKSLSGKYAYASADENLIDDTDNTLDLTDDIIDNPDDNIIEEASDTEEVPDIDEETDVEEEPNIEEEPEIVYQSEFRLPGKINQESTYDTTEDTRNPDGIYYDKKVYLTFDDGPTMHTDDILDILAQYNVKATFFVIGHEDDVSKERYKRIVNEGHVLAIHSYSHKYQDIYKSIENFDKDFTKLWNLLYDTTGYTPTLYRFPGGSLGFLGRSKMKEYVRYLDEKGMTYYDWNVVNGDAEGKNYTEEQMIDNVLNGVARKKTSIVLMHDGEGKHKTVATLPDILDALISGGAEVLPMDETVPLIQQIKASSLK